MTTVPAPGGKGRRSVGRPLAVGASPFCLPTALYYTHHAAAAAVVGYTEAALAATFTVVFCGVILFGSSDRCDRAFRLLRWLRNAPEPDSPPANPAPPPSLSA
jgi:hypothetical protein